MTITQGSIHMAKSLATEYTHMSFKKKVNRAEQELNEEQLSDDLKKASMHFMLQDYIHSLLGLILAYELFGAPKSLSLLIKVMSEAT